MEPGTRGPVGDHSLPRLASFAVEWFSLNVRAMGTFRTPLFPVLPEPSVRSPTSQRRSQFLLYIDEGDEAQTYEVRE